MWPGAPEGLVTFNEGGGDTEGLVQEDRKFSHIWGFVVEGRSSAICMCGPTYLQPQ